ncbi:hypothetical protein RRG08_026200 [Elysia crispata]|uniref:Uncharacterized protein n=1 Tax=Elysia crispata TaxID=231223 RepID=A0AAE0ZAB7_9GAST|nr:hypothetical protein RRG08_026200 [Elysia crispata]
MNSSELSLNSFKFKVGDPCYAKVFSTMSEKSPTWVPAVITKCLLLDPATSKSVHKGQRGGDTSSSSSRGSADAMTTKTLENFLKNPAVEIPPLNLLRTSQSQPPLSQQLEATGLPAVPTRRSQ